MGSMGEAKLLVALGELSEAERIVGQRLEQTGEDLTALNLFAKIQHIKGELSQAVACWARLHPTSPHNERALMLLASLLELAKDPARHAGDVVALAHSQIGAVLELEVAFRQLVARRPEDAEVTCS